MKLNKIDVMDYLPDLDGNGQEKQILDEYEIERTCKSIQYSYTGTFLDWGIDSEQTNTGQVTYTAAIVMKDDGSIELIPTHLINFKRGNNMTDAQRIKALEAELVAAYKDKGFIQAKYEAVVKELESAQNEIDELKSEKVSIETTVKIEKSLAIRKAMIDINQEWIDSEQENSSVLIVDEKAYVSARALHEYANKIMKGDL